MAFRGCLGIPALLLVGARDCKLGFRVWVLSAISIANSNQCICQETRPYNEYRFSDLCCSIWV